MFFSEPPPIDHRNGAQSVSLPPPGKPVCSTAWFILRCGFWRLYAITFKTCSRSKSVGIIRCKWFSHSETSALCAAGRESFHLLT